MKLAPSYFFLQYTSMCNSRCTTCHLWDVPPETIPVDVLSRIDRFIDPVHLQSIFFTGGEPLLPITALQAACVINDWKPGIRLIGTTNGILPDLYLNRVTAMLGCGVNIRLAVSLNGRKELHDRSRGVPGNYERAVEMALGLKALGILASLNILFIPSQTQPEDFGHVMALAQELGVPCWSSPVLRHSSWFGEPDDGSTIPTFECHGGGEVFTIRPNGDITACQEPRPKLIFGNLRDESLDPGKVATIQASIKSKQCQPCGCCTNSFTDGQFVS
jgi:MoaA/NifB/PqqE/SkfB family radical SAM enzyme